jgi:subtilisin-like proprotein convertase family protein
MQTRCSLLRLGWVVLLLLALSLAPAAVAEGPRDHSPGDELTEPPPDSLLSQVSLSGESYVYGSSMDQVAVPDYAAGTPGHARMVFDLSYAPQGARVTRVVYRGNIPHARLSDLVITLSNAQGHALVLWDRQGGETDAGLDDDSTTDADIFFNKRCACDAFDGDLVRQQWYLNVWDYVAGETGLLDYADLWAYYGVGSSPQAWIAAYGVSAGGWTSQDVYPRHLADVNGDGKADMVGLGRSQVYVSLSTGAGFREPSPWLADLVPARGWASQNLYPRLLGDVNGDGRADLVGFGPTGVRVALSTGKAFAPATTWLNGYGTQAGGWSSQDLYPRMVGDVNGDGLADIVGCGQRATYVSLSTGAGFGPPQPWIAGFGPGAGGWSSQNIYPRMLADVNADGRMDVVGFGEKATYVALSTGSAFGTPRVWIQGYGPSAGGWSSQDLYPRLLADVDGDGDADIIAFGRAATYVSFNTGARFGAPSVWLTSYGVAAGGWTSQERYPRMLGDVTGGGLADIVGCGNAATFASPSG